MRFYYFIGLLFFTSFISAQSKEVYLNFNHLANDSPLSINQSLVKIWNNKVLVIDRAEFYLSKIQLIAQDGSTQFFDDVYFLVNADGKEKRFFLGNTDLKNIQRIKMSIGVDKAHNHEDPAIYPASHPLALKEPSMHWGWAGGYRFMAIEGKVDLDDNKQPETEFQYHNLGDDLYKQVKIDIILDESKSTHEINLSAEYSELFNTLTMVGNNIVHGSSAKNNTMLTNATTFGSFLKQSAPISSTQEASNQNEIQVKNFLNQWEFTSNTEISKLLVYDVQGRLLFQINPNSKTYRLDKNEMPKLIFVKTFALDNVSHTLKIANID